MFEIPQFHILRDLSAIAVAAFAARDRVFDLLGSIKSIIEFVCLWTMNEHF